MLIGAVLGNRLGERKVRPVLGLILGLALTLIGWIIVLIVPEKQPV